MTSNHSINSIPFNDCMSSQFVVRPKTLQKSCNFFLNNFNGEILYAVKTNPDRMVMEMIYENGVRSFDVASLEEISTVSKLFPDADMYFMNPVKSRHAIREAYELHNVRSFSFDCLDELEKILHETSHASDLSLFLRLSIPNNYSEHQLSEKFGISMQEAPQVLRNARKAAYKLGLCFHVGSQCMHPDAYKIAIRLSGEVIKTSGVDIDFFNVGGGFPSIYPGLIPPDLLQYFDVIHKEFDLLNHGRNMKLLCEPGRAIVAESMSIIVRVELRKGNSLYLNDGTYGALFDAGHPGLIFPVRHLTKNTVKASELIPFKFYGPTCDSLDCMKGPFYLPKSISEGDHIEIGQLGAYGRTMATSFNGFQNEKELICVDDEPLMTMFDESKISEAPIEVVGA